MRMWIWRKLLRVPWTENRTNVYILQKIGQLRGNKSLRRRAARQKMRFFGHVMRADGLEKEMMLAHGEGKRKRGRPRRRWMEEIHKTTRMKLEKLKEATRDRERWRELLRMITRTQRVDGTR